MQPLWCEMDRDLWLLEMAMKDAAITFLWMTCMSALAVGAHQLVQEMDWELDMPGVLIAAAMLVVLPSFIYLAAWMGGACWNILSLVAFAYLGETYNRHTVVSILVRSMAQMVAAMWAAVVVMKFVPPDCKHLVGGPTLQVDPYKGVVVEGLLTYMLILVSLMTTFRGPVHHPWAKRFVPVLTTIMLVILGGPYTGPSMNPTNVYGWAVVNEQNDVGEHYAVYWLGPILGTLAAVKTMKVLYKSDFSHLSLK